MNDDNGNLLLETLEKLHKSSRTSASVRWVGTLDGTMAMSWEEFAKVADVIYDNGFGGIEVAEDLVVVGDDWWLERHEYDGSEWWEYKRLPRRAANPDKFAKVVDLNYAHLGLRRINKEKDE